MRDFLGSASFAFFVVEVKGGEVWIAIIRSEVYGYLVPARRNLEYYASRLCTHIARDSASAAILCMWGDRHFIRHGLLWRRSEELDVAG